MTREIHGVSVRFYKRTEKANLTMDFIVQGERIQESTGWPLMADAERAADKRVREVKERKQGLEAAGLSHQKAKGKYATVGEVIASLEGGDKIWDEGTLRVYKSSLLRLARVVDADAPLNVRVDSMLSEATLERFYADGQREHHRGTGVNWKDSLPCNGGLNSTMRNLKSLFRARVVKIKYKDLKLPDLRVLSEFPLLRFHEEGFIPWPVEIYEAMHAASVALKEIPEKRELWLVNAMLRRLGLRDEELREAKREWIDVRYEFPADGMGPPVRRAFLRIQNRGQEFAILKHGAARSLELDSELQDLLLQRTGYLIADGWAPSARYDLIYRVHNKWLRQFIPDRVKGNHELRMHAGSIVYTLYGVEAAKAFLGHKSVMTTERYYATWLASSPRLDAALVAKARVMPLAMAA